MGLVPVRSWWSSVLIACNSLASSSNRRIVGSFSAACRRLWARDTRPLVITAVMTESRQTAELQEPDDQLFSGLIVDDVLARH